MKAAAAASVPDAPSFPDPQILQHPGRADLVGRERSRREIGAAELDAGLGFQRPRNRLDPADGCAERCAEAPLEIVKRAGSVECMPHDVGSLKPDGEAGRSILVVPGRKERDVRTALGDGAKAKVSEAEGRLVRQSRDQLARRQRRAARRSSAVRCLDRSVDLIGGDHRVSERLRVSPPCLWSQSTPTDRTDRGEADAMLLAGVLQISRERDYPSRIVRRADLRERGERQTGRLDLDVGLSEPSGRPCQEVAGQTNALQADGPGGREAQTDRSNLHGAPRSGGRRVPAGLNRSSRPTRFCREGYSILDLANLGLDAVRLVV